MQCTANGIALYALAPSPKLNRQNHRRGRAWDLSGFQLTSFPPHLRTTNIETVTKVEKNKPQSYRTECTHNDAYYILYTCCTAPNLRCCQGIMRRFVSASSPSGFPTDTFVAGVADICQMYGELLWKIPKTIYECADLFCLFCLFSVFSPKMPTSRSTRWSKKGRKGERKPAHVALRRICVPCKPGALSSSKATIQAKLWEAQCRWGQALVCR